MTNERGANEGLRGLVAKDDVLDILDMLTPEDADVNHPAHIAYNQVAALVEKPAPDEVSWLIERGGLCVGIIDRHFSWVNFTDTWALHFSRRSDAVRFVEVSGATNALNLSDVLITQHSWVWEEVNGVYTIAFSGCTCGWNSDGEASKKETWADHIRSLAAGRKEGAASTGEDKGK